MKRGDMQDDILLHGFLNPLAFLEVDEPWASHPDIELNLEAVLRFLCTPGINSDLQSLVKRYQEISQEPKRLSVAPAERHILEKLVWPLRHAKACYMLGNYLGTIALCGMVAEMVTILIFDISDATINNKPIDKSTQVQLFGSHFEKLGQERRVAVLHGLNLIDEKLKSSFDVIRSKRRLYLHFYSQDHSQAALDAVEVFNATVEIVVRVIGQDFKDGKILLNPDLIRYLKQRGIVEPLEQSELNASQEE
jgi:hypothetical protein